MKRLWLSTMAVAALAACGGNPTPATPGPGAARFPGAVTSGGAGTATAPGPTRQVEAPPPVVSSPGPVTGSPIGAGSVENINDNSPLKPVFFQYDSDTLDEAARKALSDNAAVLQTNNSWVVTVEGHCDERGTPEYNLALGDRRALAAKNYLQSLGVNGERLKTVTYGKEFPFDQGHQESSWSQNRRAHFMLTAK